MAVALCVVALAGCGSGGGGDEARPQRPVRAVTGPASGPRPPDLAAIPVRTDAHGCGFGTRWNAGARHCDPSPAAGRVLVEMVPDHGHASETFWIYVRLGHLPASEVLASVDGSMHDIDTELGVDRESSDHRCYGIGFDGPIPPLPDPRPGRMLTVRIQIGKTRWQQRTRLRAGQPGDFDGPGADGWYRALGCR
jgi:hypothetical protein